MVSPRHEEIFYKSLAGDYDGRTELYMKFVHGSSRVRRLGAGYPDLTDYLHDCFGNLMRTGHAWDGEENLSTWVASVAAWTALMHVRQQDLQARAARGEIRMCAEMEGEGSARAEVLPAYAPPVTSPEDSPAARMLAMLNVTEQAVFRKRAMENAAWDETAAAAGKPLNAVGQVFARAAARLARLFGAPPFMDDDLVPVFGNAFVDPFVPEGRALSLQLDADFYAVTPEMLSLGVKTAYEARTLVLWESAQPSTPPGDSLRAHLDQCHYCADLQRSLLLMRQVLDSTPGIPFSLCPGSFTLSRAKDKESEALDRHLAQCSICGEERAQLLNGQSSRFSDLLDAQTPVGSGRRIAWILAAMLVLVAGSLAGYRHFAPGTASRFTKLTSDKPHPTVALDPKYLDLVQDVPMDNQRILASVLPPNRVAMRYALHQYELGQTEMALAISARVSKTGNDAGARTIYAMSLFRNHLITDAYREMLAAEAMSPRDSFRCWILLQFALSVADLPVARREEMHLSNDPQYKDKASKIMQSVRERK